MDVPPTYTHPPTPTHPHPPTHIHTYTCTHTTHTLTDCTGTTAEGTGEGELRGTPAGKGTATGPGITANANKAVRHLPS